LLIKELNVIKIVLMIITY